MQTSNERKSVTELIEAEYQRKKRIKKESAFSSYDRRFHYLKRNAVGLYNIETDTFKINSLVVWDVVSFCGWNIYGE